MLKKQIRYICLPLLCTLVLASCGGGSGGNTVSGGLNEPEGLDNDESGGTIFPFTNQSAYDPALVPQPVPPAENLLANGGFELNSEPWDLCGSATLIDNAADAGEGQRYLYLDSSVLCDRFDNNFLEESHGWAYRPINLDTVPDVLHVSMLVRASSPIEALNDAFAVQLLGSENRQDIFSRREATFSNSVSDGIDSGWTRVKLSITREEIQIQLGDLLPQWLLIEAIGPGAPNVLGIDDVRLTARPELTQASEMPAALVQQAAQNQLVVFDADQNRLVSMLGDGSSFHRHTAISTENAVSYPQFAGNDAIVFADRRFDPLLSTDPDVIPGAGSNILRYDFPSLSQTLLSEQPGTPGYYQFDGNPNNKESLDITVRTIAWDATNMRGVNGVCAQNRSFAFVSDDVCFLQIMDAAGTTSLTEIEAASAAFSRDGTRLAYMTTNARQIYLGSLNGQQISAQLLFESATPMSNNMDFSPDGQHMLIAARGAASILMPNGEFRYPYVLKELNLSDNTIDSLLLVDHGAIYSSFAYSADGTFIYYTLEVTDGPGVQVWWLERATGKTGPLVTNFSANGVAVYPMR